MASHGSWETFKRRSAAGSTVTDQTRDDSNRDATGTAGTEYDKLVRDHVPEIVEANDEVPITHTVDGEAYGERLREKLDEEVAEYHEHHDVAELADVLAVVYALGEYHGVAPGALDARRAEKARERGGFEAGIVLDRVEPE